MPSPALVLTAIGNDCGREHVFSRQLEGLSRAGDMAIGITTTGNSPNVVRAMDQAVHKIAFAPCPERC